MPKLTKSRKHAEKKGSSSRRDPSVEEAQEFEEVAVYEVKDGQGGVEASFKAGDWWAPINIYLFIYYSNAT